jgi:hypothetical protein
MRAATCHALRVAACRASLLSFSAFLPHQLQLRRDHFLQRRLRPTPRGGLETHVPDHPRGGSRNTEPGLLASALSEHHVAASLLALLPHVRFENLFGSFSRAALRRGIVFRCAPTVTLHDSAISTTFTTFGWRAGESGVAGVARGGGKTHAPSSQNGGQGSKRGTPPVIRLVWSYLVVTGSGVRPSALGMWLRRHRERREAKETRDPGGTPTAGKHLCFSPPRPSTPWTLHIDIRVASEPRRGSGERGIIAPAIRLGLNLNDSFSPTVV